VTAATVKRAVQVMPRLIHHSSAQLINTGTTISSCNRPSLWFVQRDPPIPTPELPPIFTQADDPSILTKPAPYSAQGFAAAFTGRGGTDGAGLAGFRPEDCCAGAADADSSARTMTGKIVRIRRFYRGQRGLATGRI
jgi:hypothetical protein